MDQTLIYVISALLSLLVMVGIALISKVRYASLGNSLSALAILAGIVFTLLTKENNGTPIITAWSLYPSLIIGTLIGGMFAMRVKMIQMPQLVALLNGLGGGASALVGILSVAGIGETLEATAFSNFTGYLAIGIGLITLVGSLVAAGKLHRILPQKPQVWAFHSMATVLSLVVMAILILIGTFSQYEGMPIFWLIAGVSIFSALFGLYFSIRVGGADMPITISLLNSLSGVAGAIAGMAIGDVLLVAVGGIVGASGLLLTQIMCRAMNRSLLSILLGTKKTVAAPAPSSVATPSPAAAPKVEVKKTPGEVLSTAKRVIIVPGYGMALAQAQHEVKHLADALRKGGAEVRFAIHPVAGRMPGHMNVLLAEANVPYDDLFEMEAINVDAAIVIGANDVLNPAARNAEGTPIYGMPVLNVDQAPYVVICNYDLKPGYAGVENPLYTREEGVALLTGDAKETVSALLSDYQKALAGNGAAAPKTEANDKPTAGAILSTAKRVIIVPGYGMALAQAQHEVKQLADKLRSKGAEVRFAIHPVAGRMPGHMNVLLAEANVPYDDLFEMEAINDDFAKVDAAIVIGANDVLNPAARNAEGTPIYGMPVLNVDQAPYVVICNYDLKPGYAGVENPLYTREEGVALLTGDAKESLARLMEEMDQTVAPEAEGAKESASSTPSYTQWMKEAKKVIIVPGYGMALAQAQHEVKQLADKLAKQGAEVRFAIHPVAGRMPGHMNVLLAEANVPYEDLFEMEAINNDFASTDLVVVIGANDVLNPAARNAEGTPIYGMPVLNVDQAPHVIICNYDLKPGYAGVENPLYTREEGVALLTGDAKESLQKLLAL